MDSDSSIDARAIRICCHYARDFRKADALSNLRHWLSVYLEFPDEHTQRAFSRAFMDERITPAEAMAETVLTINERKTHAG